MQNFEEIYRCYFKDVYKYMLALSKNETIAEEITQETFFKAMKKIDEFKGNSTIYVWLCQIAKNTYYSFYKKEKRVSGNVENEVIVEDDIVNKFLDREDARKLHEILHKMKEPYKEVFTLRVFGELSFFSIGELFGKTDSWVRVVFYRAKNLLKEELK